MRYSADAAKSFEGWHSLCSDVAHVIGPAATSCLATRQRPAPACAPRQMEAPTHQDDAQLLSCVAA